MAVLTFLIVANGWSVEWGELVEFVREVESSTLEELLLELMPKCGLPDHAIIMVPVHLRVSPANDATQQVENTTQGALAESSTVESMMLRTIISGPSA
eukprot:5556128-Amphidinium_carterae.2